MNKEEIINGFLNKFIYFSLQGRNRGYGEITKVESVEIIKDVVKINGVSLLNIDDALTLINEKKFNDNLNDFALRRIYKLSDKIEEDFKIYSWGNN